MYVDEILASWWDVILCIYQKAWKSEYTSSPFKEYNLVISLTQSGVNAAKVTIGYFINAGGFLWSKVEGSAERSVE